MASEADVIIEAFRPDVMKKFGLDYESVKQRNPGVVYLSVSGFGQSGPRRGLPANDSVAQAYSGFMHLNKDAEGRPQHFNMIVMDIVTGLYGYQAIASALISRFRGLSTGRFIDCSLLQCAVAFQAPKIVEFCLEGGVQAMYVPLGAFATRDGFITISTMHDHHYYALCEALARPDLAADPRYQTRVQRVSGKDELLPQIREAFSKRTTEEWQQVLTSHGILHSPICDYSEVLGDEQLKLMNVLSWVEQDGLTGLIPLSNIPGAPTASPLRNEQAPHVGEHTREILRERGVSPTTIEQWLSAGVITTWSSPKADVS
jgi:crotonobetainyl-CoA:carnitine CoA-transferase CaiB-like acyl-CoA transferase